MRRILAFTNVTLNGFFAGPNGDLSWAHAGGDDAEWNEFVAGNAASGGEMLFGRVTYEMMIQYWPTPAAQQNDPEVAKHMNSLPKYVVSRTLKNPTWNNTKVISGDLLSEVRKLKETPGRDIAILGSGSIVAQLAQADLIDDYQVVVHPVALAAGKTLFSGVNDRLTLKLTNSRVFKNGNVVLSYVPAS
jgi:dihydrofolate reductase